MNTKGMLSLILRGRNHAIVAHWLSGAPINRPQWSIDSHLSIIPRETIEGTEDRALRPRAKTEQSGEEVLGD